jgi:hypothetical protein
MFAWMVSRTGRRTGDWKNVFDNNGLLFYLKVMRQIAPCIALALCAATMSARGQEVMADASRLQAASADRAATPKVQSILYSRARQRALVDGQMVSVGERIGGATVTRITETQVVLRRDGEAETLSLFPDVEKKLIGRNRERPR